MCVNFEVWDALWEEWLDKRRTILSSAVSAMCCARWLTDRAKREADAEGTERNKNSDGSYAAAWRLPNTYTVAGETIQQHSHTGKAKTFRQAAHAALAQAEQRGSIRDTASLRSDRRYFVHDAHSKPTPFRACEQYLRKLGRCDGDLSQRRYFYIGQRHGVRVFEAYNLRSGVWETDIHQRLIWQEGQDEFLVAKASYRRAVQDCR